MSETILNNRYKILQKLGEGGFGQTFLAEDLHLPTKPRCVVKRLKPEFDSDEMIKLAQRLFEQEAEMLYRLGNHPHIPNLLAHFQLNGEFLLVQEFIEGWTLADEFRGGKQYNEREAADLTRQILETLSYVHGQNVIHRDIKPSNLIRRKSDGRVFLIDFGAVKQVSVNALGQNATFKSTVALGSHGYMPSEQTAGRPHFASDLYAAGLVIIEALTGINPLQLAQNRTTGEFVWQHKVNIRKELADFAARLVRYDYRQRYQSAKEACAAFNMISTAMGLTPKPLAFVPPVEIPRQTPPAHAKVLFETNTQTPQNQLPPTVTPQAQIPPTNLPPVSDSVPTIHNSVQPFANSFPQIAPTVAATPNFSSGSFNPPTMVNRAPQNLSNKLNANQEKSGFEKLWDNDFVIAGVVIAAVIGFFAVAGWVLVSTARKSEQAQVQNTNSTTQPIFSQNIGLYQEGMSQAERAKAIEDKATTKFEWEEVSLKYRRAAQMMDSIKSDSPDYQKAQEKSAEFTQKSQDATRKANEISLASLNSPNSSTQTTTSSTTSNYPYQQTSVTTPTPFKKAKMPGKRNGKMYLSFSSSTGDYIGQGKDAVFTDNDGNFSLRIGPNNKVNVNFNGGPDTWYLEFGAPQNMKLTTGTYNGAQRSPFNSPTRPGLSFSGSGRGCNQLTGSYTINNIIYSSDSKEVLLLDATFTQSCEGNGANLMGRIYVDARYY